MPMLYNFFRPIDYINYPLPARRGLARVGTLLLVIWCASVLLIPAGALLLWAAAHLQLIAFAGGWWLGILFAPFSLFIIGFTGFTGLVWFKMVGKHLMEIHMIITSLGDTRQVELR